MARTRNRSRAVRFRVGNRRITAGTKFGALGKDVRKQFEVIERRITAAIRQIEDATPEVIADAILVPIFDRSQQLVPVRNGDLKASGFVDVEKTSRGAQGVVGYADGGRPFYALIVHEDLNAAHEPPTQAKFLEQAVNEVLDEGVDNLYARYRSLIGA